MTVPIHRPIEPCEFTRRVLLCVTGLSPQVITETVFALLHDEREPFLPTEVQVVTTVKGRSLVIDELFTPQGGHPAAWQRMCRDFPALEATDFGPEKVHVVADANGALSDIVTPDDSRAAANSILSLAASFAQDKDCAIHASIAGGRKSMGFLLGSVMTLVGRPQDRVSHVLVTPAVESHRSFYYPPPKPVNLTLKDGSAFSTADARVTLAIIPIVTLADGVRQQVNEGRSYDELVRSRQFEFAPLQLILRPGGRELVVNGIKVALPASECAWYHYFALLRLRAGAPVVDRSRDAGLLYFPKGRTGSQVIERGLLARAFQRVPDAAPMRLESMDQDSLRSKLSDMRGRLEDALGPAGARRVAVLGPGDFERRDSRYGLYFDPRTLTIE